MESTTNTKHTCILITGPGHSATRLLINMLDKHPDVCVPMNALNSVSEFMPLHQFFLLSMDQTPLSSTDYTIDKNDLFLILDAYVENIDKHKKYSVIKLPYYPLNCLQLFLEYFDSQIVLLYMDRPIEKVVQSFLERGEDKLFVQSPEILRQVKKLDVNERVQVLASPNSSVFFNKMVQRCKFLRDQWNRQHPENTFITVQAEKLATSREYVCNLLDKIHLSQNGIDEMLSIIDRDRLLDNRLGVGTPNRISTTHKQLLPPIIDKSSKEGPS